MKRLQMSDGLNPTRLTPATSRPSAPGDRTRVLVTGSSGFVGSHVFARLRNHGWQVAGLGRRPLNLPGYQAHDLVEPLSIEKHPPVDVVIHAAARSSPWGTRRQFEMQNVLATRHVLEYCARIGNPRLVYISSSSVYYRPCDQFGITEDTPFPPSPVNLYAATKLRAEELVRRYPGPWVILRPRAVFGPGDTVLLPRILGAARAGRLPLLKPRGEAVVGDLIYIDNLVDYIVGAADDRQLVGSFNLTNREPVPIEAFLLELFSKLGIDAPRRRVSARSAMIAASLLECFYSVCLPGREPPITRFGVHVFAYSKTFDVTRAVAAMGPPRISVAEGLERTVAWLKEGVACPSRSAS